VDAPGTPSLRHGRPGDRAIATLSAMSNLVSLTVTDGIARVCMRRPEARNALSRELITDLRTTIEALQSRDYPVLQGVFLLLSVSVVIANLLADLLYSRLDPRVRHGAAR